MAYIDPEKVKSANTVTQTAFAKTYAEGITLQAVDYLIRMGRVDYTIIADKRVIVMSELTRSYTPNPSSTREEKQHRSIMRT